MLRNFISYIHLEFSVLLYKERNSFAIAVFIGSNTYSTCSQNVFYLQLEAFLPAVRNIFGDLEQR